MARAVKWVVPFKSLNGTSCSIQIYDETYSGNPIALTTGNPTAPGYAAADAFYYEEAKDKDVMKAVRASTGYIRLIELSHGSLDEIVPTSTFARYVEVFYGSSRVWFGYIQQKEFSNRFSGTPFLREFPIVSALGLIDEVYFPTYDPPRPVTFKELMYEAITRLNVMYTGIVMPSMVTVNGTTSDVAGLDASMSSLAVCPFNDDHSFAQDNEEPIFAPRTLGWFIEGLCNLYGWSVRETFNANAYYLLFTAYNYEGQYMIYAIANNQIGGRSAMTIYGNATEDLEDSFDVADNAARLSSISPLRQLEYKYDGETSIEETHNFDLDSYADMQGTGVPMYAYLTPYSQSLYSQIFQSTGFPTQYSPVRGLTDIIYANDSGYEKYILYGYDANHTAGTELLRQTFFKNRNVDRTLALHLDWGDNPDSMGNEELTDDIELSCTITCRDSISGTPEKYLEFNGHWDWSWVDTASQGSTFNVLFDKATGDSKIIGDSTYNAIHIPRTPSKFKNIVVSLRVTGTSHLNQANYYSIQMKTKDITGAGIMATALYSGLFSKKINLADNGEKQTISQYFSEKKYAVNRIAADTGYTVDILKPEVLAEKQTRLECKFRMKAASNLVKIDTYIKQQLYWKTGWHWRIMAVRFNPWNDEYTLTLHRSETIES